MMVRHSPARLASAAIGILVALLICNSPAAADDGVLVKVISVDDSGFPTLTAVVSVESGGRPVRTLDPANVTVTDNTAAVSVERISRIQDASIPTTIVLTLDTSGSMVGEKLARAKDALAGLIQRLDAGDNVGLIGFASNVQLLMPVSKDKSGMVQALAAVRAGGNTALYSAVAESARLTAVSGVARRLVILLTDGEEFGNVSGLTRDESLDRAAQSGAIFSVIGLGVEADRDYLTQLAARTGGRYLDAPAAADIQGGYSAIEETLKGQFVLSLRSSAPATPLARTISVTVRDGGRTGTSDYAFQSARPQPSSAEVVPTPRPTEASPVATQPAAAPAAVAPAGDEGPNWPVLVIVLAVVLFAAVGAVGWRYRRVSRLQPVEPGDGAQLVSSPPPLEPAAQPATARLVRRDGDDGVTGPALATIAREPVTVGWGPGCQLQLPRRDGLEPAHARLWWGDGKVMLHHLAGGKTTLNGLSVQWASLVDGDSVGFGPYVYEYRAGTIGGVAGASR